MTEDELKKIEENSKLLLENGIIIKSPEVFAREIAGIDLSQVVSKLVSLRSTIDSEMNLGEFAKDMTSKIDMIFNIINNDAYFRNNIEASAFEKELDNLKGNFEVASNYLKAEKIVADRDASYRDIFKRIHDLKSDTKLSDIERTQISIRLSAGLEHAKKAKREAIEFCEEQKKMLAGTNVVEFKNNLLKNINALDSSCRKLSLDPKTMESLSEVIRDTRDMVVLLGIESQRSQREFDSICERYGFEYTGKKELNNKKANINTIFEANDLNVTEPLEVKEENTKVEDTEKELEPKIKNVSELLESVKELNSEVEMSVKKKEQNGEMINYLEITDDASKLKLPEGFKYTEGLGINNKVSDTEPYNAIGVEQAKKKESIFDKLQSDQDSKVPSGKHKVKRTRNAIIEPYGKALLCGAAIPGIALLGANTLLGLAVPAILPVAAIGAGFSVAMQALYSKIVKNKEVEIPAFANTRYQNTPEDALWLLGAWKAEMPKLMNKFKTRRNEIKAKRAAEKANKPEEQFLLEQPKEEIPAEDFAKEVSQELDSQINDLGAGLGGR